MQFDLDKSIQVLERTPKVLKDLLADIHDDWIVNNEGGESWSPYDIIGHLVHGEKTNWMNRLDIILSKEKNNTFVPFDRLAQFKESEGKSLLQLLDEFDALRKTNLIRLKSLRDRMADFSKTGIHPELGEVSLAQLLSTWTVHDLTHISQITRVMAKQYKASIGPWVNYFRLLQ